MIRNSVLYTQERLHEAQKVVNALRRRLEAAERRVEELKGKHREQIERSLTSKDAEERGMAAAIATWWEVSPVTPGVPSEHPTRLAESSESGSA